MQYHGAYYSEVTSQKTSRTLATRGLRLFILHFARRQARDALEQ